MIAVPHHINTSYYLPLLLPTLVSVYIYIPIDGICAEETFQFRFLVHSFSFLYSHSES
jgi:hypothetical protein